MSEHTIAERTAKHTTGPWTVAGEGFVVGGEGDAPNADVVSLRYITAPCVSRHHRPTGEELEANALLMAGAPRMFDALKGLVGLVQLLPDDEQRRALQRNHRYVEACDALAVASESEHA